MGNKKDQTLLNRFRLEERLFENTLKSLQQNVLDNQPFPVLRTILRTLSHRHQQLTDVTHQLTGFLANDALETLFDSMSRISSEFENAELQVSLKETDHHRLPTRISSAANRQFQQHFCNEYTDFPPVSPPLSQSQQQPSLPIDQTAGSVFPTAATSYSLLWKPPLLQQSLFVRVSRHPLSHVVTHLAPCLQAYRLCILNLATKTQQCILSKTMIARKLTILQKIRPLFHRNPRLLSSCRSSVWPLTVRH